MEKEKLTIEKVQSTVQRYLSSLSRNDRLGEGETLIKEIVQTCSKNRIQALGLLESVKVYFHSYEEEKVEKTEARSLF